MSLFKKCAGCKGILPLKDFAPIHDRHSTVCKRCENISDNLRQGVKMLDLINDIDDWIKDREGPFPPKVKVKAIKNLLKEYHSG